MKGCCGAGIICGRIGAGGGITLPIGRGIEVSIGIGIIGLCGGKVLQAPQGGMSPVLTFPIGCGIFIPHGPVGPGGKVGGIPGGCMLGIIPGRPGIGIPGVIGAKPGSPGPGI